MSYADQLAYITLEQAKVAKDYLSKQSHVILWCACCDNDTKEYLSIENVYYKDVDYKNLYQVVLQGRDKDGKLTTVDLDLAYTHTLKDDLYHTVGRILSFECDPCTEPFKIETINGYYSNPKYTSRSSDNINIVDIIITSENVIIHLIYKSPFDYKNGGWANINSTISIKNSDEKKTYKLLQAEGIPIGPNKMNSDFKGQYHSFRLFFPRIFNLTKTIDIVECKKVGCFNFYKILLDKKS
jgi:hypothetical protein